MEKTCLGLPYAEYRCFIPMIRIGGEAGAIVGDGSGGMIVSSNTYALPSGCTNGGSCCSQGGML